MANFQPRKPPDEGVLLETGAGPEISVALKME